MTPNLDQERVERAARGLAIAAGDDPDKKTYAHDMLCTGRDREPLYRWQYWAPLARAAITAYLGDDGPVDAAAIWKQAEACVPTNWCDDLLTGPSAPRGPLDCPAVEKLLLGIIKRMRSRAATPTVNGKGE